MKVAFKVTGYPEILFLCRIEEIDANYFVMQNVSPDPPISGYSGLIELSDFFVGAFDLKETYYSLNKLKP